jgi:hypothetical protein
LSSTDTRVLNGTLRRVRDVFGAAEVAQHDPREVRLLPGALAAATTAEEALVLAILAPTGRLPVDALVGAAATAFYDEELRQGGSDAELSLLGSDVFVPEVVRTLQAGDDRLWTLLLPAEAPEGTAR